MRFRFTQEPSRFQTGLKHENRLELTVEPPTRKNRTWGHQPKPEILNCLLRALMRNAYAFCQKDVCVVGPLLAHTP